MDSAFRLRASLIFLGIVLFGESFCFFHFLLYFVWELVFLGNWERKKNSFFGSYFSWCFIQNQNQKLKFWWRRRLTVVILLLNFESFVIKAWILIEKQTNTVGIYIYCWKCLYWFETCDTSFVVEKKINCCYINHMFIVICLNALRNWNWVFFHFMCFEMIKYYRSKVLSGWAKMLLSLG